MCLAAAGRIALYYIEFEGLTFCILGAAHDQNSANFLANLMVTGSLRIYAIRMERAGS